MKKVILILLSFIFCSFFSTDLLSKAEIKAKSDFKNEIFFLHSREILPAVNTYFYVLKKYYNINWRFISDSIDYYNCYDSVMTELLKTKFGINFLDRANLITDSLTKSANWIKDAEFTGGQKALFKFLSTNLNSDSISVDSVKTKHVIFVTFEIDTVGKVNNFQIWKGINKKIDNKVIEVLKRFPNWEPPYLFGKPTIQSWSLPININYKFKSAR
ncbi:MAG TPA: hypothetical protein VNG53_06725 [Bacteroidia bacterium]|nr:hypothetical protein [Bacteroidia bacterium]